MKKRYSCVADSIDGEVEDFLIVSDRILHRDGSVTIVGTGKNGIIDFNDESSPSRMKLIKSAIISDDIDDWEDRE
jgi:hypothetical protein